ncbi:MAG TPA: multidrug efflux RND transporter permease subunit [Candidatus Eisenbacteria bacterium]|nr:multidrug efflux RND transporter permease subunit [Candidatus Eisenbacteria bacterium]
MNFDSNFSAPFIRRPVATTLLSIAIFLSGAIAFRFLPVAPLPQVDFPTISVGAGLPGASPETMASAVATPLERQFGRIASVTQMTSTSQVGQTGIVLQFDLNRDINAAARDVQAAISAARGQLPANLPTKPTYRKVNPADAPIMLLSLQSDNLTLPQMYDTANSVLAQKLAQVEGVGQVFVGGSSSPAVRVQVNPQQLNSYGISLDTVRTVLGSANANRPKGETSNEERSWSINTTDQLFKADEYKSLVLSWKQGAAVRMSDIGNVIDSVTDVRNSGVTNGKPGIILVIFRQPGANMIETVDRVRALMPFLSVSINPSMHLGVIIDRTTTIRSSIHDVEITLMISVALVILVVFIFLRSVWATIIPSVAVPLSLVGTFGVMYLCGYSLDNLSLMALTISTGFVVDDAIVVLENITRHIEDGMKPFAAAMQGAKEIGFTVMSMSISLIAVFIPILLMGGIVGRLFREFAVTLSVAIAVSLAVSLTTTPMMSARFLRHDEGKHGRLHRFAENAFDRLVRVYGTCLNWVLRHQFVTLLIFIATVALNVQMFKMIPKGFFPQQDTGRVNGFVQGDQDISFQAITQKMAAFAAIVQQDPAVDTVSAFTGGGNGTNTARLFMQLKPKSERKISADQVIARLRGKLAKIPGASLYLQAVQDVNVGGRFSGAQYQYTLQGDDLNDLTHWAPILMEQMRKIPELRDVNSDQQLKGLQAKVAIDRDTAYRLGVSMQAIDDTLYDAFGQRQVSVMYQGINQYYVVMEVLPEFQQSPTYLEQVYVASNTGKLVPLSAFAHFEHANSALTVNHQGVFPAITLSFNLAPNAALGNAVQDIQRTQLQIGMPATIHATFQGTAQAFQDSLSSEPVLILAALAAVYIVLGILYESYIHPLTILSTLPSAGVGALLALRLVGMDLSIIALIGIILLIGIVKKNAILMIDFALQTERNKKTSAVEAIHEAALLRFRPIMMTTMAALLGAVPLAIGGGDGAELRRPLGVAIVGGLIVSQLLTIFTTPVVYVYLDRLQSWIERVCRHAPAPSPASAHSD